MLWVLKIFLNVSGINRTSIKWNLNLLLGSSCSLKACSTKTFVLGCHSGFFLLEILKDLESASSELGFSAKWNPRLMIFTISSPAENGVTVKLRPMKWFRLSWKRTFWEHDQNIVFPAESAADHEGDGPIDIDVKLPHHRWIFVQLNDSIGQRNRQ